MIQRLLTKLHNLQIDLTTRELVELLWLAEQMQQGVSDTETNIQHQEHQPVSAQQDSSDHSLPTQTSAQPLNTPPAFPHLDQGAGIYQQGREHDGNEPVGAIPLSVPAATSLPGKLQLARAMRLLSRRVPSRTASVIDEEATVRYIAETGINVPILQPARERWLDVALVVDRASSMSIWQETLLELRRLLEQYRTFRNVYLWEINADTETEPEIYSYSEASNTYRTERAQDLIDPSGRRLILIVSDFVSKAWHTGGFGSLLSLWGRYNTVTALQILPRRLWVGTALAAFPEIRIQAVSPAPPNTLLRFRTARPQLGHALPTGGSLPIPVVTLEKDDIAAWVKMLSGGGTSLVSGILWPTLPHPEQKHRYQEKVSTFLEGDALSKLQLFRTNTSPTAQQLATYLAAVPLSLPVMRIVQQTMLPQSRLAHLAEVVLGGIIERYELPGKTRRSDQILFRFADGVQDLLLNDLSRPESLHILLKVSDFICERMGQSNRFRGYLLDPSSTEKILFPVAMQRFALVATKVMKRLGKKYQNAEIVLLSEIIPDDPIKPKSPDEDPIRQQDQEKSEVISISEKISQDKEIAVRLSQKEIEPSRGEFINKLNEHLNIYLSQKSGTGSKITRAQIAQAIGGYSASTLYRWLRGDSNMPRKALEYFCSLAGIADEDRNELFALGGYIDVLTNIQPSQKALDDSNNTIHLFTGIPQITHTTIRNDFLKRLDEIIHAYIARERASYRRCTKEIIAEKIGPYDRSTFYRWIKGVNRMPIEAIERLCRLTDLPDKERENLLILGGYMARPAAIGRPGLSNAPPRPGPMLGREEDLIAIKTRLGVGEAMGSKHQELTVIRGWPGVGKTTLAAALASDPEIAQKFPDGILWASLGQQPNTARELSVWGHTLGVNNLHQASTIVEMSSTLRNVLRTRRCLLIVDDAWRTQDITPFNVGGSQCALLVTTRLPEVARKIAPRPDDVYFLSVLSDAHALELLRTLAPTVVAENEQACLELVRDLEGLPLALQVAGRLLETETSYGFGVTELLRQLGTGAALIEAQVPANRVEIANETTPTVGALLKKCTNLLDPYTLDCFAAMAPFAPKPATFDSDVMAALWEVDDPKPTMRRLLDLGLLERVGENRYWMHSLLVAHARSFLEDD